MTLGDMNRSSERPDDRAFARRFIERVREVTAPLREED